MYRDLHVTPEAVVDLRCELKVRSWQGVLETILCDTVYLTVTCGRSVVFLRVLRFPQPIKLTATK